jgi:hypothetical protein
VSQSQSEVSGRMRPLGGHGLLLAALISGFFGCTAGSNAISNGLPPASEGAGGSSGGDVAAGATVPAGGGGSGSAGVLTAGSWDDNLNFDFFGKYVATKLQLEGNPGFAQSEYDASHTEFAQRTPHSTVDAALVIDTTGSMGDELRYLTAEFANISGAIHDKFPNADQRWALVLYRDVNAGDDYVVRSFDFTGDAQSFASALGQQSANGGGDYPESPELGLQKLPQLSWRSDPATSRLAFWVADAPHHVQNAGAMRDAIQGAHASAIHIYPVSASGTDDLLELTMRSSAQISGGRYLFLTDDSGIGDAHKVPEIPCYFVTKLKGALVRAVSMELTGTHDALDPADIVRTEGSPAADGTCKASDGATVTIF